MTRIAAFIIVLLCSLHASAEPPYSEYQANAVTCAESFAERLQDARDAVIAKQEYDKVYYRIRPWFEAHCRWLTDLEIAIRKIDESPSFVCDTKKGRPKGLTAEVAVEHQDWLNIATFQKHARSDDVCAPYDKVERVSLVLRTSYVEEERERPEAKRDDLARLVAVMCWQVESEQCSKAWAGLAAAGVKLGAYRSSGSRSE